MGYPVLGYQITLADEVEAEVTLAGVTESVYVAAGTYWGWMNGSGTLTGTLHQAFVTELLAHSGWSTTPTASLAYVATDKGTAPYWRATFTGGGLGPSDTFAYDGSDSTLFDNAIGLTTGALSIGALGYLQSSVRWVGQWSPDVQGERIEPIFIDSGASAYSPYDPSAHDRVRLSRKLLFVCDLPYVEAADISREMVTQSSAYLDLAGRAAGDTQGTLDDLLSACGSDSEVRLVLDSSTSYDCILDAQNDIRRDAFTTESSVGGRRYNVSLPLLYSGAYTGVLT